MEIYIENQLVQKLYKLLLCNAKGGKFMTHGLQTKPYTDLAASVEYFCYRTKSIFKNLKVKQSALFEPVEYQHNWAVRFAKSICGSLYLKKTWLWL